MCIRDRVIPALLIALLSALLIHCHKPLLLLLGTPPELMVPAREYLVWFTHCLLYTSERKRSTWY